MRLFRQTLLTGKLDAAAGEYSIQVAGAAPI